MVKGLIALASLALLASTPIQNIALGAIVLILMFISFQIHNLNRQLSLRKLLEQKETPKKRKST